MTTTRLEYSKRKRSDNMGAPNNRIALLSNEILLMIISNLSLVSIKNIASTCNTFYVKLLPELYHRASKQDLHLYPFLHGVNGNIKTLERCLDFGMSPNQCLRISYADDIVDEDKAIFWQYSRPLCEATKILNLDAIEWLLARGADPDIDLETFHIERPDDKI
jgi:hypothetical protein